MTLANPPVRPAWSSPSGLHVELEAHGALRKLALGDVVVNLFVGNALEGGATNLALRRHGDAIESILLLGPRSPTRWHADPANGTLDGSGSWQGLEYRVSLRLAAGAPAWYWHLQVRNASHEPLQVDAMYMQDLALSSYDSIRMNEYYVSQYIDFTPLDHPAHGTVLAARQNQAVGGHFPWCVIGSAQRSAAYATDALQVHGLAVRAAQASPGIAGTLPSTRLQHEHAMAALQDEPRSLAPGESATFGWFGRLQPDHPSATSDTDLPLVDDTLALPEAIAPAWRADPYAAPAAPSLFSSAPLLAALDLEESTLDTIFGAGRRQVERDATGGLLGFFRGDDAHVALRAKELAVLRPHGQVLRTGTKRVADESALTSTAWMGGVFHSMLTQGHVSINRCLSTVRTYLGLFRSHGLRMFIEVDGAWQLLDQPSAFEMRPQSCRWIYRHAGGRVEVTSTAHSDPHAFGLSVEFAEGPVARLLVCLHVALNGDDGSTQGTANWSRDGTKVMLAAAAGTQLAERFPQGHLSIEPTSDTAIENVGGDEILFLDGLSRSLPYLTLTLAAARSSRLDLRGHFITTGPDIPAAAAPDGASARIAAPLRATAPAASALAERLAGLTDLLPWLEQNALVHYLTPRGLEQFSGGGWGTRDVCQGPMELLLAQGQLEAIRDLLLRVMKAQATDGDWPQWFMFFERDAAIRADDSQGDIVFWPLLSLGQYLIASGDVTLLDEHVPFYSARKVKRRAGSGPTVWQHALRALALTRVRLIAGTALAAYGHGDWNDALQPADPAMREHMCSSWTVTLHHQTLTTLAQGLRRVGRMQAAARLEREAVAVRRDFLKLLLVDGVLAGYARFDDPAAAAPTSYLLHPRDDTTGVHYSILAMIHAIIEGLFDPRQVREHLRLIDDHMSAPDGARLFDRPMSYRGGLQRHFQRAESASFFGREIGLMYTHAHLRYAQALANVGEADRFFHALCQASPIGIAAIVPSAALRHSNVYFSSSDAAFADRYQASAEYERVREGTVTLEGGWRVYSSGAGILYGLVVRHFFGLQCGADFLSIDPVLPPALDGLRLQVTLLHQVVDIVYEVAAPGCGVSALEVDGRPLAFTSLPNPYRRGGAQVALGDLRADGAQPRLLTVRLGV